MEEYDDSLDEEVDGYCKQLFEMIHGYGYGAEPDEKEATEICFSREVREAIKENIQILRRAITDTSIDIVVIISKYLLGTYGHLLTNREYEEEFNCLYGEQSNT